MKNLQISITAIICATVIATGCTEGFSEENLQQGKDGMAISASLEIPDATRTSVATDGKVSWSAGDSFALMNESSKDLFVLNSGAGTASGVFWGTASGNAPYYALYPYTDGCSISNGTVSFKLPQHQTANGGSPAIATVSDIQSPVQFKNLCGIIEINLYGSGITVSKLEVMDLSGAPLWGDCELTLDGKEGTDAQTMTVSGGSNTVIVDLEKNVALKASSPKTFGIVVPVGSLSRGLSVRVFNEKDEAIAFCTTQNPGVKARRSVIIPMDKFKITNLPELSDVARRGYFKDIFQDAGAHLNTYLSLPAATTLGWTLDNMACEDSASDSLFQRRVICGDDDDQNGYILYPDNSPRYRLIYVNGGTSDSHGRSLSEEGRSRIVTFVNNGGCYSGSCAGAFFAAKGAGKKTYKTYLGIYPAYVAGTDLTDSSTDMTIPPDSPLLKYYDFGGDLKIENVRHNGGCYTENSVMPKGAEGLACYYLPGNKIHGKYSVWAYKANDEKGRIVCTGSHPERISSGERLDLMTAMIRYACDGQGSIRIKADLVSGQELVMDKMPADNDSQHARIGDKQYHHFKLEAPAGGAKNVSIKLATDSGKNLLLSVRKGDFAWRTDADFVLTLNKGQRIWNIDSLEEGTWYISVCCPDAPTVASDNTNLYKVSGDKSLLNGVPYSITANWE